MAWVYKPTNSFLSNVTLVKLFNLSMVPIFCFQKVDIKDTYVKELFWRLNELIYEELLI